jgi:hypothetical protein
MGLLDEVGHLAGHLENNSHGSASPDNDFVTPASD